MNSIKVLDIRWRWTDGWMENTFRRDDFVCSLIFRLPILHFAFMINGILIRLFYLLFGIVLSKEKSPIAFGVTGKTAEGIRHERYMLMRCDINF